MSEFPFVIPPCSLFFYYLLSGVFATYSVNYYTKKDLKSLQIIYRIKWNIFNSSYYYSPSPTSGFYFRFGIYSNYSRCFLVTLFNQFREIRAFLIIQKFSFKYTLTLIGSFLANPVGEFWVGYRITKYVLVVAWVLRIVLRKDLHAKEERVGYSNFT